MRNNFLSASAWGLSHGILILHKLPQSAFFPWAAIHEATAPAQVPSTGPLGTDCSSRGPLWGHTSWEQIRFNLGFSLHGPQAGPGASSSTAFPQGDSLLLWAPTCFGMGVSRSSSGCLLSLELHRLQGTAWLTSLHPWAARESAPAPEASPAPPSLPLVTAELLCSYAHSHLSAIVPTQKHFSTFLNPHHCTGSALASSTSTLEPSGTGGVRHEGSFLQATPEPFLLPKPLHSSIIYYCIKLEEDLRRKISISIYDPFLDILGCEESASAPSPLPPLFSSQEHNSSALDVKHHSEMSLELSIIKNTYLYKY